MKEKEDYLKLIEKSRPELQVTAKRLGSKRTSQMTKRELVKFILENFKNKNSKRHSINSRIKKIFKSPIFIIVTVIILPSVFYFSSLSKEDVEVTFDERFEQHEEKKVIVEEYKKEITRLTRLNKKFLEQIFPLGYNVYGINDESFIKIDSFKNGLVRSDFKSQLKIDKNNRQAFLRLNLQEISFPSGIRIRNSNTVNKFFLKEVGEIITFKSIGTNFNFVMLNDDLDNPVFSIGISK